MSEALKTWPERIYLVHSEDGYPVPVYKTDTEEILWCEDQQFDCDIEYVRSDLAAPVQMTDAEIIAVFDLLLTSKIYITENNQIVDTGNTWITDDILQFARSLLAKASA